MSHTKRLIALAAVALLAMAGCGGSSTPANDHVLRVAMGSPGEAQIRVWDNVAQQFMAAHPETRVEMNYLQEDLYGTTGLWSLLSGSNPPDIYAEWTGDRLEARLAEGSVADLTPSFASGGVLAGLFDDATLSQYRIGGKAVMVPYSSDVSNVLWYNKQILADAGVQPPTTWDELLAACDTLNAKGIIPVASGNMDLQSTGNWMAHMVSRVVGEASYATVLGGTGKFDTPEWEQAFGYITELVDHACVNDSVNAIDENAGTQLFFQGKAAMYAAGSSLVAQAIDEAPDLAFDFVNLPSMPGSAGRQGSVLGAATGYIVNAKSAKLTGATGFMALLNSDADVQALIGAGVTPLATSASAGVDVDNRTSRLKTLLDEAPAIVLPPETRYDPKVADAFYTAIATELGRQSSPSEALAELDRTLGRQ